VQAPPFLPVSPSHFRQFFCLFTFVSKVTVPPSPPIIGSFKKGLAGHQGCSSFQWTFFSPLLRFFSSSYFFFRFFSFLPALSFLSELLHAGTGTKRSRPLFSSLLTHFFLRLSSVLFFPGFSSSPKRVQYLPSFFSSLPPKFFGPFEF